METDVIHKTRSITYQRITLASEEDWATATDDMCIKFGEIRTYVFFRNLDVFFLDMRADRQTDRQQRDIQSWCLQYFAFLPRAKYSCCVLSGSAVDVCRAAVQIVEWIELERENLVRQLHLLRWVFIRQHVHSVRYRNLLDRPKWWPWYRFCFIPHPWRIGSHRWSSSAAATSYQLRYNSIGSLVTLLVIFCRGLTDLLPNPYVSLLKVALLSRCQWYVLHWQYRYQLVIIFHSQGLTRALLSYSSSLAVSL